MKRTLGEFARVSVVPLAALLALCVLVQAYLAGVAAVVNADYWGLHKGWIAIFQWLSVPLVPVTWAGRRDPTLRWMSVIPIILIAAQYSSIHLSLRHGVSWLAGLHAVMGFVLFGTLVLLVSRSRKVG
jgi:MFS-type transporter involved in bile tolerance (Atg22 family)